MQLSGASLRTTNMPINEGTRLGRYEVRSHLGTGGMGEVYRAQDTQLERTVALKILPADLATDQQRMQRFMQEAKTASALNHPNIITIHEIGNQDSTHFIATEFIDGQTLRQHLLGTHLPVLEALEIAIQIATALSAAHAAGIVHRDIKPENLMLRRDGYVKVLDFGLAKPTERQSSVDTEAQTQMFVNTSPGMVMGTVSYMSPEQARGLQLDARTDIWSLGVVLYEMLTGHTPFAGETTSDVLVAVLDREPHPLTDSLPDAPHDLQRILRKTLRKDREERYQTVKDLLVDLKDLKHDLEFQTQLERSTSPDSQRYLTFRTSGGQTIHTGAQAMHVTDDATTKTGVISQAHTTGPEESAARARPRSFFSEWGLIALVALLISSVAVCGYFFLRHRWQAKSSARFQSMQLTRLTATGKTNDAAISPDGKYISYVSDDAGQQSIWVKQVATASLVQIVQPTNTAMFWGLTFSKDGNYVYYSKLERSTSIYELFQVPVLGGASKKLITDIDSPVTFSPDGRQVAFVRNYPKTGESALLIANTDGSSEQRLTTRQGEASFLNAAWSPDGQVIAVSGSSVDGNGRYADVVALHVANHAEERFTTQRWLTITRLAWLADGSGLVMSAADQTSRLGQIWHLSYPEGEARRITNDLNNYEGISLTADSGSLVTVQHDQLSNIWLAPSKDTRQARQITSGNSSYYSFAWMPDGKIVYTSRSGGNRDIWMMDGDGSHQKQLTSDPASDYQPSVTPDGRYIFFISDRTGALNVWRMDADGGNPKQMTHGNNDLLIHCSPAGGFVVYNSYRSGRPVLMKLPVEGGEPVQVTDKYAFRPVISPDGKLVACLYWDGQLNTGNRVGVINLESGELVKVFDVPAMFLRWTPDGRAIAYTDDRNGVTNIWTQPLDGGKPVQLTEFPMDKIFWFDWSTEGKQLGTARGVVTSDVVMISEFK